MRVCIYSKAAHVTPKCCIDFLASLAGIGMIVSSTFTLLGSFLALCSQGDELMDYHVQIFFPRSIEREAGYKPRRKSTTGKAEEISLQPVNINGASNNRREERSHGSQPHHNAPISPTGKAQPLIEDIHDKPEKRTEVWEMVTSNNNHASIPHPYANRTDLNITPRTAFQAPPRRPRSNLHPLLMNYVRESICTSLDPRETYDSTNLCI